MGKTEQLTWKDARAIFNLIGELRELGRDTMAWRQHMVIELCKLVGAKVGFATETDMPFNDSADEYLGFVDIGWGTSREREVWIESCEVYDSNPSAEALRNVGDVSFTEPRQRFADDRIWYKSDYNNLFCKPADMDHFMISNLAIPRFSAIHVIQMIRPWGEPRFSARELNFIAHFHNELSLLWNDPEQPAPKRLPRHLHQTLLYLAKGFSEKELADRLGVRQATVHGYVKNIYRIFGVHSRSELMAVLIRRPAYPWLELTFADRLGQVHSHASAVTSVLANQNKIRQDDTIEITSRN